MGAVLGALLGGPLLPGRLLVRLGARDGLFDPGVQPAVVRREIALPGHGGQRQVLLVGEVDELLQLDGPSVQPVEVPDHDGVDLPVADVGEHPLVLRSRLAVGGGSVVVDVLGEGPALGLAQLHAVVTLPGDGQLVAVAVLALPEINGCSERVLVCSWSCG